MILQFSNQILSNGTTRRWELWRYFWCWVWSTAAWLLLSKRVSNKIKLLIFSLFIFLNKKYFHRRWKGCNRHLQIGVGRKTTEKYQSHVYPRSICSHSPFFRTHLLSPFKLWKHNERDPKLTYGRQRMARHRIQVMTVLLFIQSTHKQSQVINFLIQLRSRWR